MIHWWPKLAVGGLAVLCGTLVVIAACRPSETALERFLREEGIAGAVVATGPVDGDPVVTAVGEAGKGRPLRTDDRFRLASLSKPITAQAVLLLAREGRLDLDAPLPELATGATARDLLRHSGGWDRQMTFDPISDPEAARNLGLSGAYGCLDVARKMPNLQFKPGTRYAYSNIGYCWLGLAIERASGRSYEAFVREAVLPPGSDLKLGGVPTVTDRTGWPGQAFDALGPGGGWLGTAGDYWRFAAGPLISPEGTPPYARPDTDYYGLGWRIWPDGSRTHFGALPGIFTFVMLAEGQVSVMLFNGRPRSDEAAVAALRKMQGDRR